MSKILEISNLNKSYDSFYLNNINLGLERGYVMGFIGPNGAGKTTTIKLIMNLIKKNSGEIKVFGLDNIKHEKEIKEKIGFVYDENYFYDELNLEEMKRVIAPFYSEWDEKLYQKYLRDFELPAKKKIKELSKGMKLKFSLAIALSHRAELLVMDEPTSGLDPIFRNDLLDIIREYIADDKRGVLFSSHVTSDLDKIADFITMINKGEIILSMSKEELMDKFILIKGGKSSLNDKLRKELVGCKESSLGFEALCKKQAWIEELNQKEFLLERPSLEEIMLYMIRGEKNA